MASTFNYFAFGSNLTRTRLFARVGVCEVVGVATIAGHRMSFRKRSHDGTAKCDLHAGEPDDLAEGVVFRLPVDRKPVLDRFEGVGAGYEVVTLTASLRDIQDAQALEVIAYQAVPPWITDGLLPYCWYRDFVLEGGRAFGLSSDWISRVESHEYISDADPARRALNASILAMSDEQAQQMSEEGNSS